MDDAARAKLVEEASYNRQIPGFGTYVPGKGKMAGYMAYMTPTGDHVKLSPTETRELYAINKAMKEMEASK